MITNRIIEYENAGNLHTKQISGIIREICTTPEMQACITSIQHLLEMDLYTPKPQNWLPTSIFKINAAALQ